MSQRPKPVTFVPLDKETASYLQAHPEVAELVKKVQEAQEVFGRYINPVGPRIFVRELGGGSTLEVELDATVSRASI